MNANLTSEPMFMVNFEKLLEPSNFLHIRLLAGAVMSGTCLTTEDMFSLISSTDLLRYAACFSKSELFEDILNDPTFDVGFYRKSILKLTLCISTLQGCPPINDDELVTQGMAVAAFCGIVSAAKEAPDIEILYANFAVDGSSNTPLARIKKN